MKTTIENPAISHNGKIMAGIIILIIGGILLIQQFNLFFIPGWLFSWPMWLIAYGVYLGGKYNFRKPIWIWMVVLGSAFLLTENMANADRFVWPVAIIGLGGWMITKHTHRYDAGMADAKYKEI
jgi:hypothetical protein